MKIIYVHFQIGKIMFLDTCHYNQRLQWWSVPVLRSDSRHVLGRYGDASCLRERFIHENTRGMVIYFDLNFTLGNAALNQDKYMSVVDKGLGMYHNKTSNFQTNYISAKYIYV